LIRAGCIFDAALAEADEKEKAQDDAAKKGET